MEPYESGMLGTGDGNSVFPEAWAGIPGVLVHGRADLSCPATTAHELAVAWPGVELHIVDGSGHTGSPELRAVLARAGDSVYERLVG